MGTKAATVLRRNHEPFLANLPSSYAGRDTVDIAVRDGAGELLLLGENDILIEVGLGECDLKKEIRTFGRLWCVSSLPVCHTSHSFPPPLSFFTLLIVPPPTRDRFGSCARCSGRWARASQSASTGP